MLANMLWPSAGTADTEPEEPPWRVEGWSAGGSALPSTAFPSASFSARCLAAAWSLSGYGVNFHSQEGTPGGRLEPFRTSSPEYFPAGAPRLRFGGPGGGEGVDTIFAVPAEGAGGTTSWSFALLVFARPLLKASAGTTSDALASDTEGTVPFARLRELGGILSCLRSSFFSSSSSGSVRTVPELGGDDPVVIARLTGGSTPSACPPDPSA